MANTEPAAKTQQGRGRRPPLPDSLSRQRSSASAASLDTAEEIIRVGNWSVRRLPSASNDASLVYVDMTSGAFHSEPPQEVLYALDMDEDGGDLPPPSEEEVDRFHATAASTRGGSEGGGESSQSVSNGFNATSSGGQAEVDSDAEPQFRRIVLGASHDTPLKMARDLLEAIQEDRSIFGELQRHFSDFPSESCLGLDTLPECLEIQATLLDPGDVSDVLATESGMQILLRVS